MCVCVASNIGVRGERDLAMMHAASSEELEEDKKKKHTYGCTRERARSYSIPQWLKRGLPSFQYCVVVTHTKTDARSFSRDYAAATRRPFALLYLGAWTATRRPTRPCTFFLPSRGPARARVAPPLETRPGVVPFKYSRYT